MPLQLSIMSINIDDSSTERINETFNQEIINFGRKSNLNDVVLDRPEVSGKHMRLRVDTSDGKKKIFVTDLGSLNGTTIEGRLLEPQVEEELLPGERIGIGSYIIKPVIVEGEETIYSSGSDADETAKNENKDIPQDENQLDESDELFSTKIQDPNRSISSILDEIDPPSSELESLSFDADFPSIEEDEPKEETNDENKIEDDSPFVFVNKESDEELQENIDSKEENRDELASEETDNVNNEINIDDPLGFKDIADDESSLTFSQDEAIENLSDENIQEEEVAEAQLSEEETEAEPAILECETGEEEEISVEEKESNSEEDVQVFDFDAICLCKLSGVVTHKGEPLEGVKINAGKLGSCDTSADGAFSFNNIDEDTEYEVTVEKDGYSFNGFTHLKGCLEKDMNINIDATKLFKIRGNIKTKSGNNVAGVIINAGKFGKLTSDDEGNFELPDIPEDTELNFVFEKNKYRFEDGVDITSLQEDVNLDITCEKLSKIEGVVRHKGQPLPGVTVDGGALGCVTTDENGYYCFNDVPEGTKYTLSLSKEGYKFGN